VQAGAGNVVENDPKTLSSRRTLPLDDGMVAVLRRASARYAEERLSLGTAHADSGYVAVNEAGERYMPDTLTRMWQKLAGAAGVRPIRLHDARHCCGTALHLRACHWPSSQSGWATPTRLSRRGSTPTVRTTRCALRARVWVQL
jgi:integrase